MSKDRKYAINLTLFKIIGFYQMVDPNGTKLFGYNVHNCVHTVLIIFTSTMTLIGLSGFVYKTDSFANRGFKDLQMLFYIGCITVGNLKLTVTILHADKIWNLIGLTHQSYFSNKFCKSNYFKLVNRGERFAKIFPWYFFLFFMTAFSWITLPRIIDYDRSSGETNAYETTRKNNVVNMRYPISAKTYNTYYNIIYAMEAVMCSYCAYGLVTFDLFIISLLQMISTQYEIVSSAYENLKYRSEDGEDVGACNEEMAQAEFLSITLECQNIYRNLETIYWLSRVIVLIYMVLDAIGMVSMPYLIVVCFIQNGSSIFNTDVMTFFWTLSVAGIQSYMFCNLFQHVNERKEAINFALYSCDWTWLNIRMKKLILLTLRMNSSNNLRMYVTPTTFIDLPMLATIVRTSYSITSVMINSNIHDLQKKY